MVRETPLTLVRCSCLPRSKNLDKSWTYQMFNAVVGAESLLHADKATWIAKRRAFNPGFAPNFLKGMVGTMAEKLERFRRCIDADIAAGAATDMLTRSQTFTSDVIVAVAFGEDWGGGDVPHPARVCECVAGDRGRDWMYQNSR